MAVIIHHTGLSCLPHIHIALEFLTCGQGKLNPPLALLKPEVLDVVRLKIALRRRFMHSRDPADKGAYRRVKDNLEKLLHKTENDYFADLLCNPINPIKNLESSKISKTADPSQHQHKA